MAGLDEELVSRIELALRDGAVGPEEVTHQSKADRKFIVDLIQAYETELDFLGAKKLASRNFIKKILIETCNSPEYWRKQAETAFTELELIDRATRKAGFTGPLLSERVREMAFKLIAAGDDDEADDS